MKLLKKFFILFVLCITFVSAEFANYEEAFEALTSKWDEIVKNLNDWLYDIWMAEQVLDNTYENDWYTEFDKYGISAIYDKIKTKIWKLEKWRNIISSKFHELYTWLVVADKAYYTTAKVEAHKKLKETYKDVIEDYPYYSWALTTYYKKLDVDLDYASEIWGKFPDYWTGEESKVWTGITGIEKAKLKWDEILLQLDKDWDYKKAKADLKDAFNISTLDLEEIENREDEYYKYQKKLELFQEFTGSFEQKLNNVIYNISAWKSNKYESLKELKNIYKEILSKYSQFPNTSQRLYFLYSIKIQSLEVEDESIEILSLQKKLDSLVLKVFNALQNKYKSTPDKYKTHLKSLVSKFSKWEYGKSTQWKYIVRRFNNEIESYWNYKEFINNWLIWYFSLNWGTKNKAWWYYRMKAQDVSYSQWIIWKSIVMLGSWSWLKIYKSVKNSANEYYNKTNYYVWSGLGGISSWDNASNWVLVWEDGQIQDKIYYNETYNLSIKHPSDWLEWNIGVEKIYSWTTNSNIIYSVSKLYNNWTEEEYDTNTITFSIAVMDNPWLDLENTKEQLLLSIKDLIKWTVSEEKKLTIDWIDAYKIVYEFKPDIKSRKVINFITVKDEKIYQTSFSTFITWYNTYTAKIDEIMNTFKFSNQSETTVQSLKLMDGETLSWDTASETGSGDNLSGDSLTGISIFSNSKSLSLWFWMKITDTSNWNKIFSVHRWWDSQETFTLYLDTDWNLDIKLWESMNSVIAWKVAIESDTRYHVWLVYDAEQNLIKTYINWIPDIYSVIIDLNIENPTITMWNYYENVKEYLNTGIEVDELYTFDFPVNTDIIQMLFRKK